MRAAVNKGNRIWFEQGMDFADALHFSRVQSMATSEFATFDRIAALRTAEKLGIGSVVVGI